MKIAYLFFSFTRLAGTERILIDKMNYFADHMGYDVTVITYEQGEHPFVFPLSDKVHRKELNTRFFTLYRFNVIKRLWLTLKMRKLFYKRYNQVVDEIKPDIIICTTYRDFEIKAVANCPSNAKKIIESHISKANLLLIGNERIAHNRFLWAVAKIREYYMIKNISRFDQLIALTKGDAMVWSKIVPSIVIQNSITYYPDGFEKHNCKKRVISVGRLAEMKGYDMLIDIWITVNKVHKDWSLYIYGEGGEHDRLQRQIQKNNLERSVLLCGVTTNIYSQYKESDIYLMSSRYEGFGLVLIEAMSCGLPCIAFDCPYGPSDIISDGKDGFVVPMFDKELYAKRIMTLIEHEDLRQSMSVCARKSSERFKPENIIQQWDCCFKTLLNDKTQ